MVGGGIDPRAAVAEALYVLQWADVRKRTAASQVGITRRLWLDIVDMQMVMAASDKEGTKTLH